MKRWNYEALSPTGSNSRTITAVSSVEAFGFRLSRINGSHHIFVHQDIPELKSCSAFGKTPAEALAEVEIAKDAWLAAARAEGKPIPQPSYKPEIYQIS